MIFQSIFNDNRDMLFFITEADILLVGENRFRVLGNAIRDNYYNIWNL